MILYLCILSCAYHYNHCVTIFTVQILPTLHIIGETSVPDVGLLQGAPVMISYQLDGSKPAEWEFIIPSGIDLADYAILIPMFLPPLQFLIANNGTFFNGTFHSVSTVISGSNSFTLSINGTGLVMDGNSINVTFESIAYGNLDLSTYTYNLSAVRAMYDVTEETPGRVTISTVNEIDTSLDVYVLFEYNPEGDERPFDGREFTIDHSDIIGADNRITFTSNGTLGPKLPPLTIHTIGDFTTPRIPLSFVKAAQEIEEDDPPIFWQINIPRDGPLEEYPRALPLLMAPVSLAFSSNVLDIIGDVFTLNVTLTTNNNNILFLTFTSMGIVDSTELDNVQILNFTATATGSLGNSYVRGFENDTITMNFREDTPGSIFAVGNVEDFKMRLHLQYDNKTANQRFTNVELRMSHTDLITADNTMRFDMFSELTGWNSICPEGSGGFRCFRCQEGYFGAPIRQKPCKRCDCNGHSNKCHRKTGRCRECADNTIGRFCQLCADGFYGNAKNNGTCNRKLFHFP